MLSDFVAYFHEKRCEGERAFPNARCSRHECSKRFPSNKPTSHFLQMLRLRQVAYRSCRQVANPVPLHPPKCSFLMPSSLFDYVWHDWEPAGRSYSAGWGVSVK
jgi:hypothetical protein